jgi:hypothetical protein
MIRINILFAIIAIIFFTLSHSVYANETNDVLSQIEQMVALGEKADPSLTQSIADEIENNPSSISSKLILKLNNKNLFEKELAVYIWALGLTKDPSAVNIIEAVHKQNKSDLVRMNCLRALANIGGIQAGEFLLSILETTSNESMRFEIMDYLGQMQCEAALPKMEEVLKKDSKEFYWQSIFIFGKMGDKGIPYLLKQINHKDKNIRTNTINLLGQWLMAPEAAKPLQDQFWIEKDEELRLIILSSLERIIVDLEKTKSVFEQINSKEKNNKLIAFTRETLNNMNQMKTMATSFKQKRQPSAKIFQNEYNQLFKSAGKKGSYEILGNSCTEQNESQLKTLRERILQRNSDEAFYDYQEVNKIITLNRLIKTM